MNQFDPIAESFVRLLIICFFAGISVCLVLVFGVPWLWGLIKPWLHAITG